MIQYILWIQTDTIGKWRDSDDARRCVLEYIAANPEETDLRFGIFKGRPLVAIFTVYGTASIVEHFDG